MLIRNVMIEDASQIANVYNHYVVSSHATFEFEPISAPEMSKRIRDVVDGGYPFHVADENETIIGYAYVHAFRPRPAYRKTVEISVYVKDGHAGRGVATRLYESLICNVLDSGYHSIIAGIALPNDASVRLHERFEFEKIGHFREVGRKFDRWFDVCFWQLSSKMTGRE
jgi:phosphinothricin acetyltransferase